MDNIFTGGRRRIADGRFGQPSHALKITDVELFKKYEIPGGWDGVGEKDLKVLEEQGFLRKLSETIDENDPLEKIIVYEILKPING